MPIFHKIPPDLNERLRGMKAERSQVISIARSRWGAEVTYEKRGKSTFWKLALEDGGAYTIYERRQDYITPLWLLEIAEGERFNCCGAMRTAAHEAILKALGHDAGMQAPPPEGEG